MCSREPKMRSGKKSITVVLGMHRGGTSAITRGLQTLGVDLGERLVPPAADNDEMAVFEDADVKAINIELLNALGREWHTLAPVPAGELLHEKYAGLRLRAIELLRSRLQDADHFGLKDPRLSRLLPFWKRVFEHLRLDISYVIAVRNPLSVAKSLEAKYRLPHEKSHYLWLQHMLPCVLLTQGARRVLVDFDLLLDNPQQEFSRMAAALCPDKTPDSDRLAEFSSEFLDARLRHARYEPEDVLESPSVPVPVRTAVMLLAEVAADRLSLDSEEVAGVFGNLAGQMAGMAQAMNYLLQLDGIIAGANRELADRSNRVGMLGQGVTARDSQIAALKQTAAESEVRMAALSQGMAEHDAQIAALAQTIGEREARIVELSQGIAGRDGEMAALAQTAEAREARIAALDRDMTEREGSIAALTQTAKEHKAQISLLNRDIAERDGWIIAQAQTDKEHKAQIVSLSQDIAERDKRIEALIETVRQCRTHMAGLTQGIAERDDRIETLLKTVEERNALMAALTQGMAGREGQIAELMKTAWEREAQTDALSQAMAERDERIAELMQTAEEREAQMNALSQDMTGRDGRIEALLQDSARQGAAIRQLRIGAIRDGYRLEQARSSFGWKLFRPVRMVKGLLPILGRKLGIDLLPLEHLKRNGCEWLPAGRDGQFLLMAERAWHGLAGWYWLDVDMAAERPIEARLCFDTGAGFDPSLAIKLLLAGRGAQRIPLLVPSGCCDIRLDLFDMPEKFGLSAPRLNKLREAPDLPGEFLAQSGIYEALGWRKGNVTALEPANGVHRHDEADYCWRSRGGDPWFVLQGISRKLRPGWYMIELQIRSDIERGNAKLYFDYGEGYSERTSVVLPFRSGQESKRLCHLPGVPKQVRFDPLEGVARFSVERLNFAPVMAVFAYHRILQRLCNRYAPYKNMSLLQIWRDLQAQEESGKVAARELLFQCYTHTFLVDSVKAGISDIYERWIAGVETPEFSRLDALAASPEPFKLRPTVSIVIPVYNTAEKFLRQALESVLAQGYSCWELCIADDASTEPHVKAVLEEYMRRDPRIKVVFREENGHISAASNSALALATGEYVALLDHDDELARHALHFVVEAINRKPSAQILYSDEDKIGEQGNRSDPHFKPEWNPDLFLSQNYVSHLGVYRRELLQRIGGFRDGVEGSQDHDLLLRCLPHVKPAGIVHIPKVLYHWRMAEGSTALNSGEKSYTAEAGIKALENFFSAQGRDDVKVENGLGPNTYRVRYPVPQPEPPVSLLIPTRDKRELLEPCVRSILDKTTYRNYEIVILDNESSEPATLEFFERIQAEDSRVRVLAYHRPFNYSAINNYGVQQARGELIGLVNNDIEVISPEWLDEMASHALRPEIGCVGAKLYYEDETIQHAGVIVGLGGVAGHSHKYFPRESSGYFHRLKVIQNLSAVTAACLVVRKSVYEQVGGLEEDGLRIAFNDVDFCLKVREAGYRNLWTPYAELFHYESKSRGAEDTPEKVKRFHKEIAFVKTKWGELLQSDPCYSPNLTLAREDFSLEVS